MFSRETASLPLFDALGLVGTGLLRNRVQEKERPEANGEEDIGPRRWRKRTRNILAGGARRHGKSASRSKVRVIATWHHMLAIRLPPGSELVTDADEEV